MQMTRNTVSNSNKATTLRQLSKTVPFLAHPARRHMRMVLKKILQRSVAQFEFSCTYLAHGHIIQRNVGVTFFIQRLQTFFKFLPRFYIFNVSYFCLNVFTSMLLTLSTPAIPNFCCSKTSVPYWSNPTFFNF